MLAVALLAVLAAQQPALRPLPPADVQLIGWLGERIERSRLAWLDRVDLAERLEPFVHRPAKQPWAGEHVGKWLHAAALSWAASGDAVLRARLDQTAQTLIATQEEDGYLGTYLPAQRFQLLPGADWDVWTIKYALIGLLEYHAWTGDAGALDACRRAADLLVATFAPGKRSIVAAGTHVGMAATSVLEPIVRLYRTTGEARYLEFARRIVAAWDEPGGPRIASALGEHGRVARTANGKAYEMLSNLVGLCELYRATGDPMFLVPVRTAWDDIVAYELLPTGSMSSHEHFVGGGRLPSAPASNLGETCVTVTWLQLNAHLLEITGDARYGREIERTAYNHLAAAQRPDGAAWCYYTALRGQKPYDDHVTCCSSSGPRGLALLPRLAVLVGTDGTLCFDLLEPVRGSALLDGKKVTFELARGAPWNGRVRIRFGGELPARFALRLRLSEWGVPATLGAGDDEQTVTAPGFCTVPARTWRQDDTLALDLRCDGRVEVDPQDPDRALLAFGPSVLALDSNLDAGALAGASTVTDAVPERTDAGFRVALRCGAEVREVPVVPFADAGAAGGTYRVWLPAGADDGLVAADSSRSRPGNVLGSIVDRDRDSFVVTFDGKTAAQDWYSVRFAAQVAIGSVTFAHGHCFHDGGWFDASAGKPVVQVRSGDDDAWTTIGTLDDYPATTATDARGLRDGMPFTLRLPHPVTAREIRVAGRPACGDSPAQAFSSCAELGAGR